MSAKERMSDTATQSTGRLPDFLIIGAAKSGTSTLYTHLASHPRIFMSEEKEPCFFDPDVAWDQGFDWYRALFRDASPQQLCGEASTNYTRWPQVDGVPARIAQHIPDAKLIYLMRDPVKRAFSHYVHRYTREVYPGEPFRLTFEEFVEEDPMCLDGSEYATQIQQYLEHFPREAILPLRLEDLSADPRSVLRQATTFLSVDPDVDLLGEGVRVENPGFGEGMLRYRVTKPLRSIPLLRSVADSIPQSWRDGVWKLLRSTSYAQRVDADHTATPMREETRRALAKRFEESNRYLEREFGMNLEGWTRG